MGIGSNIKRYRHKAKMTQKELGEKLGITQQQIAQYESGKRYPKIDTVIKLADALGCSHAELEDKGFDCSCSYKSGANPIIVNGYISPEVTDIDKMLSDMKELPFTVLTESEKLIVYFNSLNDMGKDKVIEYMELLLSVSKFRNFDINLKEN